MNEKETTMKVYKFRSLTNELDFCRIKEILQTGEFWCSKFMDMNDPMEGLFIASDTDMIDKVFSQKNNLLVCSFSKEQALTCPLMWSYYANGFKGLAIEVQVKKSNLKDMKYNSVSELVNTSHFDVKRILSRKFKHWEHEQEVRYFCKQDNSFKAKGEVVGRITAVYFGEPFKALHNKTKLESESTNISDYLGYKQKLQQLARNKDIECFDVNINAEGVVEIHKECNQSQEISKSRISKVVNITKSSKT